MIEMGSQEFSVTNSDGNLVFYVAAHRVDKAQTGNDLEKTVRFQKYVRVSCKS